MHGGRLSSEGPTGDWGTAMQCKLRAERPEKSTFWVSKVPQKPKREIWAHQLKNSWPTLPLSLVWMKAYYTPRWQNCSQENSLPKELLSLILPALSLERVSEKLGEVSVLNGFFLRNHVLAQSPQKQLFFGAKLIKWVLLLNLFLT